MKCSFRKIMLLLIAGLFVAQTAFAAVQLTGVRYSKDVQRVRIVLDVAEIPIYDVKRTGNNITLTLKDTVNKTVLKNLLINDPIIKNVTLVQADNDQRIVIALTKNAGYKVDRLTKPDRIYIDIEKMPEGIVTNEVAPGVKYSKMVRYTNSGMLTGYFLDVDMQKNYAKPVLARGRIAGREAVSGMSERSDALAAINSSYFAPSGELIGLTKLDNQIVSTTYVTRGAIGLKADGSMHIGQLDYAGMITANGITIPVSGVNCERGENAAVIYNSVFSSSTKTNKYGREYVVENNRVAAINTSNSPLKAGQRVVSVHGTSAEQFAGVKVGDTMIITEDIGEPWNSIPQIISVGPLLVQNRQINVTSVQEQFGTDVTGGRAPRTAVGITKDKHLLMAVVDGRQSHSIGCTLREMANLMLEFGAIDAVNFDGGGSSEMVIGGQIMNQPSDGGERSVGAAMAVFARK